jgi:hypothetical protein
MYWGSSVGERPQDFVDHDVAARRREALVFILRNGLDAHPGIQAKGSAYCRICGEQLGSMDLTRFGFVWPEKAEHYVLEHDVWTPECTALLETALSRAEPRVGAAAPQEAPPPPAPTAPEKKWWFEDPGPAFFNRWSFAHVGWGVVFQLLFPERYLAGLVVHTIYESIEGYIFPREDRDTSMRNHVGDTAAFAAGMLVVPAMNARLSTGALSLISGGR